MRPSKASSGHTRQVLMQGRVEAYTTSAQWRGPGLKETWKGPGKNYGWLAVPRKKKEERKRAGKNK